MRIDLGLAYIKDSDKCKQQPNEQVRKKTVPS